MFTKSNGHVRDLVCLAELPSGVAQEWFDYVTSDDYGTEYSPRFFEYRGAWYDVNDGFTVTENMPRGVQAWQAESAFSAVGIRYTSEEYDAVVVTYCHW